MITSPCQQISQTIGQLFECSDLNGSVRIRTPYLYPDGDFIDLFLKTQGEQSVLTDFGETLRWLEMQTFNQHLSKKQELALQDIQLTHDIELHKGILLIRIGPDEAIAEITTRLAQAVIRISDLWFLAKTRVVSSITDEVADFLKEQNIRFTQNEKILGRSGRSWRPDFHTWQPQSRALIQVLSTGSRSAANSKVNNVLASWYDLSNYKVGRKPTRFISLFDDTLDVWGEENLRQLEELSDIAYWSRPDELAELLAA